MKILLPLLLLAALAACGVDGEPERPAATDPAPVVTANIGYGESGLRANAGAGFTRGPVTVYVGI
ncbi:hypothetical protein AB1M95_17075 [Sulfitobacter sp. LCG007]